MSHPALAAGNTAVITGGASGIGLACAKRFASLGLAVCIADRGTDRLERAAAEIAALSSADRVLALEVDVRRRADLERLEGEVRERFGGTDLLMNNAAIGAESRVLGPGGPWQDILETNLWGVIHGSQVFAPAMIARGRAGLIVNTGSKQGITTPPGNPAYNVAKAGVKSFTEAARARVAQRPRRPHQRASAHSRLRVHRHDAGTRRRQTEGGLDPGTVDGFLPATSRRRRFLHPLPRQRCAACAR